MSNRYRTLTITLEQDADDIEARAIARVIEQIKGVAAVTLGEPVDIDDHTARMVVQVELRTKIHKSIEEVFKEFPR